MTENTHTASSASVLVIDSNRQSLAMILKTCAAKGIYASVAKDISEASRLTERNRFNAVFIDSSFCNGRKDILNRLKTVNPELPVILLVNRQEDINIMAQQVVSYVLLGITDILIRPFEQKQVVELFDKFFAGSGSVCNFDNDYSIVGCSSELVHCLDIARRTAKTSIAVLLCGESGTGKELFARLIHRNSRRSSGNFITVNCAALSESLLESELFGHEKGAFTGAISQRKGRFEMADGGTIFLDEISETPLSFQSKLLRVLEHQEFQRVGSNENIHINVRLICTTNRDMMKLIRDGKFRLDLYYRICGVKLVLPPLRNRKDDMQQLMWHFINMYAPQIGRHISRIDNSLLAELCSYSWPGNIRQLRNVVRMLLVLGTGDVLSSVNAPWLFEEPAEYQNRDITESRDVINNIGTQPLANIERQVIIETLRKNNNNQKRTADILGISDRTLRDKIKRYRQLQEI